MLNFELNPNCTPAPDGLLAIAQARCEELRSYGFCAQICERSDDQGPRKRPDDELVKMEIDARSVCVHITGPDGKCYENGNVDLTPDYVKLLAQLTTKAHVQHTLDELAPRMILLGCDVTIVKRPSSATYGYIHVAYSDGKSANYAPTYGDMMQLRRDVAIAEVDFLVGKAWPTLQKAGYQRLVAEGCYAFSRPSETSFVSIPFGQVDKAKEVLKDLEAKLTESTTT